MAVTQIWKVSNRLDHVLAYTTNAEKTDGNNYKDLHNVIDYIEADYKTEEQLYVTGINCMPETAYNEMIITKKTYHKEDGIQAFHAFQSFAEGEVAPELCHKIGVKLAEEMWGDRFEVVVSTHLNTNHYHNHFVINSVSFKDGKRYYDKRSTYAELRNLSDSLCNEYGLTIVKPKRKKYNVNYENYQKKNYEYDNYYTLAKKDLDRAIGMATSYYDFEELMKAMDYNLIYRYNKLSIRRYPYKKNIRIQRYFGEEYSIDRIKERIDEEHINRIPFIEEYGIKKHKADYYRKKKPKGFYALFIHYCYLLKVFPKKYPYQRLSPEIRIDIKKMEEISKETRLLTSNDLKTDEQFFLFKEEKENKLNELIDRRNKLWYKHKTSNDKDIIKKEIDSINEQIEPIRKEVNLCKSILERSKRIEENIKKLSNEEVKEEKDYEHIRRRS